jgi:hypothetical protein
MKKIFVCVVALCAYSCAFGGLFADAGGDYLINLGEEITLAGSSPDLWPGGGQPCHIDISDFYGAGSYDDVRFEWYVDDAFICSQTSGMVNPLISYDYLVGDLNLDCGQHTISMYAYWMRYASNSFPPGSIHPPPPAQPYGDGDLPPYPPCESFDTAVLFIADNTVPEPATMLLLTLGGVLLRKRK